MAKNRPLLYYPPCFQIMSPASGATPFPVYTRSCGLRMIVKLTSRLDGIQLFKPASAGRKTREGTLVKIPHFLYLLSLTQPRPKTPLENS